MASVRQTPTKVLTNSERHILISHANYHGEARAKERIEHSHGKVDPSNTLGSIVDIGVKGAMTFGEAGKEQARIHDLETVNAILDIFQAHGHYEVRAI